MHPYIPHLLEDIKNAQRKDGPLEEIHSAREDLAEHFEEVERWLSAEEPPHTFGYYCGLKAADFPPPEQLSIKDMKRVSSAFEKMMYTWNLDISFPEKLPVPFAYKMLVELLDTKTMITNSGFVGFDFCNGDPSDCVFKEYCSCLEHWNDETDFSEPLSDSDDEDLPF